MTERSKNNDANLSRIRKSLEWALQALASPAEIQLTLFPAFVVIGDELALDFDACWMACRDNLSDELTQVQLDAILDLDAALCEMSGPGRPEIWSEEGCLSIRELAHTALSSLGWTPGVPPTDRSTYVPYSPDHENEKL